MKELTNEQTTRIFNFMEKAYRLRNVDRCSTLPKFRQNSVAEHSYYFCLLCLILGEIENTLLEKENATAPLDVGLMIKRGILHDIEESITGDINYTAHQASKPFREELLKLRYKMAKEDLFIELKDFDNLEIELFSTWENAKDDSQEGKFLYYLDKLELLFIAREEMLLGNKFFQTIIDNCMKILAASPFGTIYALSQAIGVELNNGRRETHGRANHS